jgi:hypothetical protein
MASVSPEEIDAMIEGLKDAFGIAEDETVTENSYAFKNKTKAMREDILFLKGVNDTDNRLFTKYKYGFDR